jgi:hypothetical protein
MLWLTWYSSEAMGRSRVKYYLRRHEAQLIYLCVVTHQVNSHNCVILPQSLANDLNIVHFKLIERKVDVDQRFVI